MNCNAEKIRPTGRYNTAIVFAMAGLALSQTAVAEEAEPPVAQADPDQVIEEVVVIGRYKAAATDIVSERIESDVPMDFLDAEGISRVGDSNVASALRRVPGVTLVQNQFVYVRGLGERYSSSQLNGAGVPSPDLTRNVLPLNIFPAEIIDALSVQKGYSPDLPASFGGGNIDIRTKAIPEDRVFSAKINTGWNTESNDDGLSYSGGADDKWGTDDGTREIPRAIVEGIQRYRGSFAPLRIQTLARAGGDPIPLEQAEFLNRELATSLNRALDLRSKDMPADLEAELTAGYRWFLGEDWELGFLAIGSYSNKWRNRERSLQEVTNPSQSFSETLRTINQVTLTAGLNVGLRFTEDHEIKWLNMFLRNTEDEASVSVSCKQGQFNDCVTTNTREVLQDTRFEQRDLDITQFNGVHKLGDATLDRLPEWLGWLEGARDSEIKWFYTDAEATTDLPNETRVKFVETFDDGGNVLTSQVRNINNSMELRYSDLLDDVETWGGSVMVPFTGTSWDLELTAGGSYNRKGRGFQQTQLGLGTFNPNFLDIADGDIADVFSDENVLNPLYGYELFVGIGQFGTESYGAGQITDASFGKFDLLINDTWRFSGGARWENFKQVSVPIDYLNFNGERIPLTVEEIEASTIQTDEWYPALSATWIRPQFWGDEFQLRLAWSETTARPDLREISVSTYIDPLTEARVRGNPFLVPSDLKNYDVRAEWFWDGGDNFTASLFYKDITQPIETIQGGATEDNIIFTFINAETAEIYGLEIEGLKSLGFLSNGGWSDAFYIAGNATFSDSEVQIAENVGGDLTNRTRRLTQHSEWVANLQLGFDSFDGKWGSTLVYNAFGPRIFFAGINGQGDAYEQTFHSLDFVLSWFPTENLSLKFRAQNMLDQTTRIDQENSAGDEVRTLEQTVGTSFLFDIKYEL
jgi:outer membrane receptor protein involved in Fe transport